MISVFIWVACKNDSQEEDIIIDTTINKETGYNNLFLDSSAITTFLIEESRLAGYKQQYLDFYQTRNYQYAWFDSSGLAEQASNFINLLSASAVDFNDSSLYNQKLERLYQSFNKNTQSHKANSSDRIKTEFYLTGQFFIYASKVYGGDEIDASELGWYIPRKRLDLTSMLNELLKSKGRTDSIYHPLNSQYQKLKDALMQYSEWQKQHPQLDTLAYPSKILKRGDSSLFIREVKKRLSIVGDLPKGDTNSIFTKDLSNGVTSFQERHGLNENGKIDKIFIAELNISLEKRIQQLIINIERARWMPAEKDSDYLSVNIPEYQLNVYEKGKLSFKMPVIVGKEGSSTVIFNNRLKYIVFAPYWNIPTSIVKNEILPAMRRNPSYTARRNMEIVGHANGIPVVRQKPGSGNALGKIKFLFPNNYNIYLHDTPNKSLFKRTNRSFSHGCIRLSEPEKLARFLLRDQPKYDTLINKFMDKDKETWITLKKSVPVFITYFTAWVDADGRLNFRQDIYDHDAKMAAKLFIN